MSAASLPAFLSLLALLAPPGGAQGEAPVAGGRLAVYLITFGPGPRVWERFGHNAIWIRDTVTGTGPAYDYGRFSFGQERFLLRFARGEMWYWMGRDDGVALVNRYLREGRSVWLQELNLQPAARIRLLEALEADFASDSGRYRYDYYRANCSTRIRDALDRVAEVGGGDGGGAIRAALGSASAGVTYRFHSRRSLENNLLIYAAVVTALGPAVDEPISKWEAAFLPLELQRFLREVRVADPSGREKPLVKGEVAVAESELFGVPPRPGRTPFLLLPAIGAALGVALVASGRLGRRREMARRVFIVLAGLWELLVGVAALLLLWFWALSEHVVAHGNANVFQFNLLALATLAALSALAAGARGGQRAARLFALAAVGASAAGPLIQWLTGWGQHNAEVVGFALPAHLGVWMGLIGLQSSPEVRTPPEPSAVPPAPR